MLLNAFMMILRKKKEQKTMDESNVKMSILDIPAYLRKKRGWKPPEKTKRIEIGDTQRLVQKLLSGQQLTVAENDECITAMFAGLHLRAMFEPVTAKIVNKIIDDAEKEGKTI